MPIYICLSTYAYLHMPIYVCLSTYAYLRMPIYVCLSTSAYLHMPIYVCLSTYAYLRMPIYVWRYVDQSFMCDISRICKRAVYFFCYISFAKEPYKRDCILQKRPLSLRMPIDSELHVKQFFLCVWYTHTYIYTCVCTHTYQCTTHTPWCVAVVVCCSVLQYVHIFL